MVSTQQRKDSDFITWKGRLLGDPLNHPPVTETLFRLPRERNKVSFGIEEGRNESVFRSGPIPLKASKFLVFSFIAGISKE